MRKLKRCLAIALATTMMVSLVPANNAGAAKKVKLNKKSAEVEVRKTVKLSVKNAKKTAKVTWKTSSKKVAKITKKTKKGNAYAVVKGLKAGKKATITATVKTGKKSVKVKCVVSVVKAEEAVATTAPVGAPSAQPSASAANQSAVPSQAAKQTTAPVTDPTAKPSGTPRPTKSPKPSPTPEPSKMPVTENEFAKVAGVKLDNSTFEVMSGNAKYDDKLDRIEINDAVAGDMSQGAWKMPEDIAINKGDLVTFRVQGYFYGSQVFRFWIGTGTSGGCTPILLRTDDVAEENAVGEYPAVVDGVTKNEMKLELNDKKAYDVTFTFKAGESQDDSAGEYPNFTLKGIHGDYINGLVVNNVYLTHVNGKATATEAPTDPTAKPTEAPTVEPSEAPTVEPSEAPTVEPSEAPTVEPSEAPTVEPSEAPTVEPSEAPTVEPSEAPTAEPSEAPEAGFKAVDLSNAKLVGGEGSITVAEDGSVSYTKSGDTGFDGFMFAIGETLSAGDKLEVKIDAVGTGSSPRIYLLDGTNDFKTSVGQCENVVRDTVYTLEVAPDKAATHIFVKVGAWGQKFDSLTVRSISVKKVVEE